MLTEKYLEVVIEEFLKNRETIVINDFVRETGVERQDIVKYLRMNNNYEEKTIGAFVRKR